MNLNELREMVEKALKEHGDEFQPSGLSRFAHDGDRKPFEEPEEEEEGTELSFADDDEDDRPAEGTRSLADVRKEIYNLMDSARETLKTPTEKHQKKYAELMGKLLGLNQELENLTNAKEKQQQ